MKERESGAASGSELIAAINCLRPFLLSLFIVYALTDFDFRRVVWQLIDANAWVIGIGRRSQPRDFQDFWWVSSASVSELRARKVGGVVVPLPVSARREVGASALRMRHLTERRRVVRERADAEREYREASAAYESWMATRRSPTAFPIDPEDELAIVARCGTACRRWAETVRPQQETG